MVVIFVGALLRTFSVLAMYAVRMQDNACPPSYGACTELDKKQSSKRVRARILDLEARQQSEAERCCCWYPWHINDAVLDDIQAIAQEEALVGLSPANAKSLKSYFEKLQRKQRSCFSDRSEVVTWVGAITTAVGCYGTMMVADAQPGIVALEYGFPALCVCGCCTLAAAKLLQERYSISDFKRNNALDSLLATVSDAAASEKSTRAVRMDNNKGKHKSRASVSKNEAEPEEELDDILSEDEREVRGPRRACEMNERDKRYGASTSRKSTRAACMDNNKGTHKSRVSDSDEDEPEEELDDILSEDERDQTH